MVDVKYLEEERVKLWSTIKVQEESISKIATSIYSLQEVLAEVDELVKKKTADHERDARGSSKKASEYRNKAQETFTEIGTIKSEIDSVFLDIEQKMVSIKDVKTNVDSIDITVKKYLTEIKEIHESTIEKGEELAPIQNEVSVALQKSSQLLSKSAEIAQSIQEYESKVKTLEAKITAIHQQSAEKKREIEDKHNEVFGYEYQDDKTGESLYEEGLVDKLEKSYSELDRKISELESKSTEFMKSKTSEYELFLEKKTAEFHSISEKIKSLLPDALTAGLSHAYEKKREAEVEERKTANKVFYASIFLLALSSSIPIGTSYHLLFNLNKEIGSVIADLPRLVLAILPLYLPLFWLALTSSKKSNLSKRLIEEYTHKETMSKTFEGLSTQIASIGDDASTDELRMRLLYNIVNVNSENPGKLITNYNTADHPMMELLDKSISMSESLNKFMKIPGIKTIAKIVLKESDKKLSKANEAVEKALKSEANIT